MKIAAISLLGLMGFVLLWLWLRCQLHYRIGSKHVKITLFGLTIRRIALQKIARISKRRPRFAENWSNTLRPSHRTITLVRSSGLRRNIIITPKNRYVFMADLQNAMKRVSPEQPALQVEAEE